MTTFLTILLVILMVLVVASLVRGVVAFLKSTKIDLESGEQTEKPSESEAKAHPYKTNT